MKKWLILAGLLLWPGVACAAVPIKTIMADSEFSSTYRIANMIDGNINTYWEGTKTGESVTIELDTTHHLTSIELKLPPENWPARTQQLTIDGSEDGITYINLTPTTNYEFNPASGNSVMVNFLADHQVKFIKLTCQNNSASLNSPVKGCQIAELVVDGEIVQEPPIIAPPIFTPPTEVPPPPAATEVHKKFKLDRIHWWGQISQENYDAVGKPDGTLNLEIEYIE